LSPPAETSPRVIRFTACLCGRNAMVSVSNNNSALAVLSSVKLQT
jgi:hypothetical protein